jgi:hypothetical protein
MPKENEDKSSDNHSHLLYCTHIAVPIEMLSGASWTSK